MIQGVATFLAGVLLLQGRQTLPSAGWLWLVPLLVLPLLRGAGPLRLAAAFALGFLIALGQAHWRLGGWLPPTLEGRELLLEGRVASLPRADPGRMRFDLAVDRLLLDGRPVAAPALVRLSWYRSEHRPAPGESWRLLVKLRRPRGSMNPGGFDYAGWLYRQGIGATGYVRASEGNRRLAPPGTESALLRLRWRLGRAIDASVASPRAAGLLRALVIGDRSGLGAAERELLRRTGSAHLVAISGLHIGIVAGFGMLLGRLWWRRSARLCQWLAAERAGAVIGLMAAVAYAALAGFSIPTQRALWMSLLLLGGIAIGRPPGHRSSLALAMLAVLLWDPAAVLAPGFWLSFMAVTVILITLGGRLRPAGAVSGLVAVQGAVTLGLAPLLLTWDLPVSPLAPLVNLLLVPLFGLLLVPAALSATLAVLGSPPFGEALYGWLGIALEWLWQGLALADTGAADWPMASGFNLPGWGIALLGAGGALLLAPAGIPGRILGLVPMALLVWPPAAERPDHGDYWFDLLDVGQGMAAVVQTRRHVLVFDAGPRHAGGFDAGRTLVAPFLRWRGVTRIDRLVLSNGDRDHSGGAAGLLASLPATRILSGEPGRIALTRVARCRAGEEWRWDGVVFRFLHPGKGEDWRGNDASCVLRVEGPGGRLLLTGDIEERGERALVSSAASLLRAELVVVPHHGSATSSSPALVAAVAPRWALVSAGHGNRYGFPRPQVVARWRAAGARLLTTAEEGAIGFRVCADGPIVGPTGWRRQRGRYWNRDF